MSVIYRIARSAALASVLLPSAVTASIIGVGEVEPTGLVGTTNSNVAVTGQNITVGRNVVGSLTVNGGNILSSDRGSNIGRNVGSNGSLLVSGPGSQFNLIGIQPNGDGAFWNIGAAGTATIRIENGGRALVDGTGATTNPVLNLGGSGLSGIGGNGSMEVVGAGSSVTLTGPNTSRLNVGRSATGSLLVDQGGNVTINSGDFGGLVVARTSPSGSAPGTGAVVVDNGSSVVVNSPDGRVEVGQTGAGTMTVRGGSTVLQNTGFLRIGNEAGSVGVLNVSGPGARYDLTGVSAQNLGGIAEVGRSGEGTLNLDNGAELGLTSSGGSFVGMQIGGTGSSTGGGTGTANVDGATLRIESNVALPFLNVGRNGVGALNISNGGVVDLSTANNDAVVDIGRAASQGDVDVTGSQSVLRVDGDVTVGAGGTARARVAQSGRIEANNVSVGAGGVLTGDSLVAAAVTNYGTVRVGDGGAGELGIDGSYLQSGTGVLELELLPADHDLLAVTGDALLDGILDLDVDTLLAASVQVGDTFTVLTAASVAGTFGSVLGAALGGGMFFDVLYNQDNVQLIVAQSAPAPVTVVLFATGGLGVLVAGVRRRRT